MLGAGVFVTTGRVARANSGPSVFISYIIAGLSAPSPLCVIQSSLCIFQLLVVLLAIYWTICRFFAGANILMECVLSNAAVARSFTEYLCCALRKMIQIHGDFRWMDCTEPHKSLSLALSCISRSPFSLCLSP
ncbi:hypothetical protein ACET3Z_004396 [Daucus carota]